MMRVLILILSFFLFSGSSIETRRVYQSPDGTILIKTYPEDMRKLGESNKQLMDRIDSEEGETKAVLADVDIADIPVDRSDREKWRIKDQGGKKIVFVDPTAPSPKKDADSKKKNDKTKAKNELKQLGLSDDSIAALGL